MNKSLFGILIICALSSCVGPKILINSSFIFNTFEGDRKLVFFKELSNPTLNNFESEKDEINALS